MKRPTIDKASEFTVLVAIQVINAASEKAARSVVKERMDRSSLSWEFYPDNLYRKP